MSRKNKNSASANIKLLVLLVILAAVFATYKVYENVTVLVSQASIPSPTFDLYAQASESGTGLTKYTLKVKTSVQNTVPVSLVNFRLMVPDGVNVLDSAGNNLQNLTVGEAFADSQKWAIPVNRVYVQEGKTFIDMSFVSLEKQGFEVSEYVDLAYFYIRLNGTEKNFPSFEIDTENSAAYSKKRPVTNIWEVPSVLTIRN